MTGAATSSETGKTFSGNFRSERHQWNGNTIDTFHYHDTCKYQCLAKLAALIETSQCSHITASAKRQQKPSILIPFRRDRDFVDRSILRDVEVKCSEPAAQVALVGLGGMG